MSRTFDLFDQLTPVAATTADLQWPAGDRFPINAQGSTVRAEVVRDLLESAAPLVVAGYTALDQIIDLVARSRKDRRSCPAFGRP